MPASSGPGLSGLVEFFKPAVQSKPEPYGGQKNCPVTGRPLGVAGSAIAVNTGIGAAQPTAFGKLFGRKPKPGAVVYVCCPACVAKVQSDRGSYLVKVIAEVGSGQR